MTDRRRIAVAVLTATVLFVAPVFAQTARTEGEVRKIDKDTGKITIRHGPVPEFDMSAMTMVFRVADPALLDRLKGGDRIVFTMTKAGGVFTVTEAEQKD